MTCQLNRRGVLALAGFAIAATSSMASAQTKWNLPAAYATGNYHTENLVQFAKDVEAATGGKLSITVHGNASLFKAPEIKRAVATGQAQIGEVLISLHENEDAVFGIDVVPFLATSFADARKLWLASQPAIEMKLAAQGLMIVQVVPWGPQGIYAKKELKSVEDMKGLKWRSYNAGTSRIAELAGAQPVTIQAAELPQALATGVDHFLKCDALRPEVILTSARGIHGPPMRETVAYLMLSVARCARGLRGMPHAQA